MQFGRGVSSLMVGSVAAAVALGLALPFMGLPAKKAKAPSSMVRPKSVIAVAKVPRPVRGRLIIQDAPDVVSRESTVLSSPLAGPMLDVTAREFTVFDQPTGQDPSDVVSRETSVFSKPAGPTSADVISRETTVFANPETVLAPDAVSRETTVFSNPEGVLTFIDAVARELTIANDPVSISRNDAVSREFTIANDPVTVLMNDAVSRELTIVNDPQTIARNDVVSREFTAFRLTGDLVVSEASAPENVGTDVPFVVNWSDKNQGGGTANGPWTDRVWLSVDDQLGADDVELGRFGYGGDLDAGQSLERSQDVTIARGLVPDSGTYYLIFEADSFRTVFELGQDDNNWLAVAVDVSKQPLPDLVVQEIEAPANAFFGTDLTVRARVKNVGNGATDASEWTEKFSLFRDGQEPVQATALNPTYLAPGEEYWTTAHFKIPNGTFGQWNVRVTADFSKQVREADESNNILDRGIEIQVPPLPDLRTKAVLAPEFATAGDAMPLQWTVDNVGDGSVPLGERAWNDAVYLSTDTVLSGDDRRIHLEPHTGNVAPGAEYSFNGMVALPRNVLPGSYFVLVAADNDQKVYEFGREANNVGFDAQAVTVFAAVADLEVTAFTAPRTADSGDEIEVRFSVVNNGPDRAEPGWFDAIYLSNDDQLDTSDTVFALVPRGEGLDRKASYEVVQQVTVPDCLSDRYYLFVKTDSTNAVQEGPFEQNNVAAAHAIDLNLTAPDLRVTSVTNETKVVAGQRTRVQWRVSNAGNKGTRQSTWTDRIYLSRDNVFSIDDLAAGAFSHTGVLGQGADYRRDEEIVIPSTAVGTYFVLVIADADDQVEECSGDTNNAGVGKPLVISNNAPDLVVTSVSTPASAQVGEPLMVEWSVTNSGTSATGSGAWGDNVFLSRDNAWSSDDVPLASSVHLGALAVRAGYSATAQAIVPLVTPGDYYVVVQTDFSDAVFEGGGEGNNGAAHAFRVEVARVDLKATGIEAPTTALSGQPLTLRWTVTNLGQDKTWQSGWADKVVLSRDRIVDGTDRQFPLVGHSGQLDPGASYDSVQTVDLPAGLSGDYYLIPVVDWNGQVPESDELNNDDLSRAIQLQLPPPVDLRVESITPPTSGSPGETGRIDYRVENIGQNTASGKWVDSVYLSLDDKWDIGDALVGRVEHVDPVVPGGSYDAFIEADMPPVAPGDYRVIVKTNARNTLREVDITNNTGVSDGQINMDLVSIEIGQTREFSVTRDATKYFKTPTPDGLTLQYTADPHNDNVLVDLKLKQSEMVRPSYFDFASRPIGHQAKLTVPTSLAGMAFGLLAIQSQTLNTSTVRLVSVPFGIESCEPVEPGNGIVTLRIEGGQLFKAISARILDANGKTRRATALFSDDAGSILATFDLTNASLGPARLLVSSETEEAELSGITVSERREPSIEVVRSNPPSVRRGSPSSWVYELRNSGNVDAQFVRFVMWTQPRGDLLWRISGSGDYGLGQFQSADVHPSQVAWMPMVRPGESRFVAAETRMKTTGQAVRLHFNFVADASDPETYLALTADRVTNAAFQKYYSDPGSVPSELLPYLAAGYESFAAQMRTWFREVGLQPYDRGNQDGGWGEKIVRAIVCGLFCELLDKFPGGGFLCGVITDVSGLCDPPCELDPECEQTLYKRITTAFYKLEFMTMCGPEVISTSKEFCCITGSNSGDCPVAPSVPGIVNCGFNGRPIPVDVPLDTSREPKTRNGGSATGGDCQEQQRSADPNDKLGPVGFGPNGSVGKKRLDYSIRFENIETAGAAVARIHVVDQLGTGFDPRSVAFGTIRLGSQDITLPDGTTRFAKRVTLAVSGQTLYCDMSGSIDLASRRLTWTLQAIDPLTGEPPVSSNLGLLIPEDGTGSGQGYVRYSVRSNSSATTGEALTNSAEIVFDNNESIRTKVWTNSIDSTAPSSAVSPIVNANGASFQLTWGGQDGANESGLANYDIYVATGDGPYQLWLSNTKETNAVFDGTLGLKYRFYSRARDNVGNLEVAPDKPDATVDTSLGGPGLFLAPAISSFVPNEATAGAPSFKLIVRGTNFQSDIKFLWNGEERPVVWKSAREIEVDISSTLIEEPTVATVQLVNPGKNGGGDLKSQPKNFVVR